MIKATGVGPNGEPVVLLGLSGENVTRLIAGEPIRLDLAELGLPPTMVVICYGRTEDALVAELRRHGLIDAETRQMEAT